MEQVEVSTDDMQDFSDAVIDFTETLAAAELLWKSGDHDGAWLALEELPPIDKVTPEVVDLRLRICTNLGRWDLGDSLARVLPSAVDDGDGSYLITCAQ